MPLELHWPAITLRLLLTLAAGALIGMERSRSGHPAGLRTTLLVMLAASVSMIQMNLLIQTNGKPANSYAVMDLMRLPLGILTGVGFIGAGAIVRKGDLVLGVTTAATIWFSTVIGLCLGGGQLALGVASTLLGYLVLSGLRWVEARIELYQPAELRITVAEDRLSAAELRAMLESARFRIRSLSMDHCSDERRRRFECHVRWPTSKRGDVMPAILADLERRPGVTLLEWRQMGAAEN
jgi:putative Mg2+ transporter-C (MgtC) family protein